MSQPCRPSFHCREALRRTILPSLSHTRCVFPHRCLFLPLRVIAKSEESLGERVWKEYGKAVEKRDLKKALKILETVQILEKPRDNFRFVTDIEQEEQEEEQEENKSRLVNMFLSFIFYD